MMAARESMKLISSAKTLLRLGCVLPKKIVPVVSTSALQETQEIFVRHRCLTMSPAEAYLSSRLSPLMDTKDFRLPPVLKEATIAPTLYNGAILEKDLPSTLIILEKIEPIVPQQALEMPSSKVTEKLAARLIVIRRKKMKKHKLRKMRKKMRFVMLKRRQRREYKKEKLFQAEQMAEVRKYEAFDAAEYVKNFLDITKQVPVPRKWKGKRLPKFVIEDLIKKKALKKIEDEKERLLAEELKKMKKTYVKTF